MTTLYLGADHAATHLKERLKQLLAEDQLEMIDLSPSTPQEGDDYPDYALAVAEQVAARSGSFGLLLCDTGIGMAIAANKVPGMFAALVTDMFGARRAREHNDANILVLGSELTDAKKAAELVRVFVTTPFSGAERHRRRLGKIRYFETHHTRP